MLEGGSEPRNLTENFIEFLKNISIVLSSSSLEFAKKITLFPDSDLKLITNANFDLAKINLILNTTIEFYRDIKNASNPYLWAELMVIELANLSEVQCVASKEEVRAENISISAPKPATVAKPAPQVEVNKEIEEKTEEIVEVKVEQNIAEPQEEIEAPKTIQEQPKVVDTGDINYVWSEIVSSINGKFAQAFFKGVPLSVELNNNILTVGFLNQNVIAQANSKMQALREAVNSVLNPDVQIVFMQNATGQKTIAEPKIIEKKTSIIKEPPIPEENYLKEPPQKPEEASKKDEKKQPENFYSEKTKMYIEAFNGKVVD
jgi:DNA polymerase III gamma/tau subunit